MQSLKLFTAALTVIVAGCATTQRATAPRIDPVLTAIVNSPLRTAKFVARDAARHPAEELSFLGLTPTMTVVELWPAPGYWTEILGPYLAAKGHYSVAHQVAGDKEFDQVITGWVALVSSQKSRMGTIAQSALGKGHFDIAAPGSADLIVTFRNLHNWMGDGDVDEVLAACYRALKPGGVLGIEDHRGRNDRPQDPKADNGYVREDYAIDLLKRAGFEWVGSSEVNANPRDTKDWVDGVWTLPPALSQGDKDRARYVAIGEADNFVLKFRKPTGK